MELRAGIDIGTNTILLLIAEVEGRKVSRVREDHVRVVRLGQGVDKNRAFHPDAMTRARECFRDYSDVLKKYPGIRVRAVATSGSRDAANSPEFFAEIERDFGIKIRVISGEEEAQMSFLGALPDDFDQPEKIAVIDIGGGSTEIVGQERKGSDRLFRFSFDMGCVRLTERYMPSDPPVDSQIQKLRAFVKEELGKQPEIVAGLRGRSLIGVAGTATYLASSALGLSKFDPEKVQGTTLTLASIRELIARFSKMSSAERLGVGGMDKGRADVIVAGALILEETMQAASLDRLTASVRGLRYGAVLVD
jgi:exopolyphosphatase / guanosine-5'-triphosphate,3'-diphosphate pyrophosphatase